MADILHVIIKKDYAASLMEHLQKEQAIEIVAEIRQTYPSGKRKRFVKH